MSAQPSSSPAPSLPVNQPTHARAATARVLRHQVTQLKSTAEEPYFSETRSVPADLPDPEPLIRNLARGVFEAIAGVREVEQIARWVSPDTFSLLLRRAQHAARARRLRDRPAKRPHIQVRGCLWKSPRAGVVESSTVVDLGVRARAVSIRLEVYRGRWRAERIHVL